MKAHKNNIVLTTLLINKSFVCHINVTWLVIHMFSIKNYHLSRFHSYMYTSIDWPNYKKELKVHQVWCPGVNYRNIRFTPPFVYYICTRAFRFWVTFSNHSDWGPKFVLRVYWDDGYTFFLNSMRFWFPSKPIFIYNMK